MSAITRRLVKVAVAIVASTLLFGCGGAAKNDQGTTFTLLGFYTEGVLCDEASGDQGLTGMTVPLSGYVDSDAVGLDEGLGASGILTAFITVQNNLSGQFIRTQRVFLDYYIPGASAQPPSTAVGFSSIVPPIAAGEEGEGLSSSLPDSLASECNRAAGEILVVPSAVRTWISLNRASLPEAPFTMMVSATATGLSSSGDRFDSNPAELMIEFTPDVPIEPTGSNAEEEA